MPSAPQQPPAANPGPSEPAGEEPSGIPTPPGEAAPQPRITDLDALKVFTHPLRIELFRLLTAVGPATASHLAEQVDEAVSLVSYHLRKMAAHGFLTEARGGTGDARERWWQVSPDERFTFRSSDFDGAPEGAAVARQVVRRLVETRTRRYAEYLDTAAGWPREWRDAAFSAEYLAYLTTDELTAYAAELQEVAERWGEHGKSAAEAGDAPREHVSVHLYGFPFRP